MSTLDARKNFAIANASTGYSASDTSITLATGKGALFPQPSTDGAFNLVWWNSTAYPSPADDPNKEIVRCTARTDDVLTVTRAQEGTSASVKNIAGQTYKLQLGPTKKTIDDIETQLDLKEVTANKGAANGYAPLGSDSKVPSAYMPQISITDTFVVTSQVEMLALTAETGDVAVRTDENKTYILKGTDPSVLADWEWMRTPTDNVLSVNGMTGSVTLTTTDIAEGTNLYFTAARAIAAFTIATGLTLATATLTANLSTGISGGQSVIGGTATGENLTLSSTGHATKGKILFGTSAYDEVNNNLGVGTNAPATSLGAGSRVIQVYNTSNYSQLRSTSTSTAHGAFVTLDNAAGSALEFGSFGSTNALSALFGVARASNSFMYTYSGSALTIGTAGAQNLTLGTSNTARVTVDLNGLVGIGIAAPTELLHLYSATTNKPILLIENANADGTPSQLRLYKNTVSPFATDNLGLVTFAGRDSNNNIKDYVSIRAVSSNAIAATAGGEWQVFNLQNNVSVQALTLSNLGYFGVGTTAPVEKLHVSNGVNTDSGTVTFLIGGSNGANARTGRIIKDTTTPYTMIIRSGDFIGTGLGNDLRFQTNNGDGDRMVIKGNTGDVGIGVTPADRFQVLDGTGYITMGQPVAGYGGITFANAAITTANYSMIGDGTSTFLGAATGGVIYHRINNVSAMFMTSTVLTSNTVITHRFGSEWDLTNNVVAGVAVADVRGQGTNPMALRVIPGASATGYTILGELTSAFFEFHRVSTGSDRLFITAPTTAASGYRIISYNSTPRPITLGFSTNATSYTAMATLTTVGVAIGSTTTVPTAQLHLSAGTATASTAPLKFTSGTNLTTGEAGAMEYNGTNLFFTRSGTTRESVLIGNSGATAPTTSIGAAIVNYYGSGATNFLGDPNSWAAVNIGGVDYKIPLYT